MQINFTENNGNWYSVKNDETEFRYIKSVNSFNFLMIFDIGFIDNSTRLQTFGTTLVNGAEW